MMTIRDVARYLGVSEGMVRSIDKAYLQKTFGKPRLRDLEVIAIDEIYVGRRNKFFTIVIDWRSGAIVYVGTGKGQDALNPFWKRLRASRAKIKAVSTDMSSAYYAAVMKHLPKAKQVFDRFHIVKLMNEKLTQLRRDLQREAETMNHKVLTGTRWLLVKHPTNLDESKNERVRLQEALDLNRSLAVAYYLKEDLSQLWQQSTKALAAEFLTDWCHRARASGIRVLSTMARTLEGYRTGILNWYDYPISSGRSKESITRSERCSGWPMGTKTRITSSPNSTHFTLPSSLSLDNHYDGTRTSFRVEPNIVCPRDRFTCPGSIHKRQLCITRPHVQARSVTSQRSLTDGQKFVLAQAGP
jgi:transposase